MNDDEIEREAFAEGLIGVTRSELEAMPDAELAHLQSGWAPNSARNILAQQEWQRRQTVRQLQEQFRLEERLASTNRTWSIWASIIGVVGTLAGAVVGSVLQARLSTATPQQAATPPSSASVQSSAQRTSEPAPPTSSASQVLRARQAAPGR